jgi:hypothetical protein
MCERCGQGGVNSGRFESPRKSRIKFVTATTQITAIRPTRHTLFDQGCAQATPNPICSTVLGFLNERSSDSACSPIALRRAASGGSTPFASMTLPTI